MVSKLLAIVHLKKEDVVSIFKGLVIAMLGAGLIYLGQTFAKLDFGQYTPFAVAMAAVLVNVGRKIADGK